MDIKKKSKKTNMYGLLHYNPLFKTKKYRFKKTGDHARIVSNTSRGDAVTDPGYDITLT